MKDIEFIDNHSEVCTDTILMVEPVAFGFNPETSVDNFFTNRDMIEAQTIQERALNEFNGMVKMLRAEGVNVIVLKDKEIPHTPDSIFPNNWISFHANGKAVFYPMSAKNRRLERRMDILLFIEEKIGKKYELLDLSRYEQESKFLEGTGSMVFDRENQIAYACSSPRTNKELFYKFCEKIHLKPICFNATQKVNEHQIPIYHTNVMMCIADRYAVICLDAIENMEERKMVAEEIINTGKEIIDISLEQMDNFAGNMLQVKNSNNEKLLVMSQISYQSLTEVQKKKLEQWNKLLVVPIPTIQKNGGGGVRCMMAEVF